jgi:uncharacterized phage protein (TIGR02220 family)/predicted phage replisome organizer
MVEVKWIKLNVGMFDGKSFKRIKKAKIGGESFRDKLTAVWFELMDFAGKCNAGGQLIESPEIPFSSIEDIAIMIDREPEELNLCMQYFISNRMITVIDDVYMLTNWAKYQNEEGLEKIRAQNRIRQKKWYDNQKALPNVSPNVRLTQPNATDIEQEKEKEEEKDTIPYASIIDYLNEKTGTNYRATGTKTKTAIHARFADGFTEDDFRTVIDKKCKEWLGTEWEKFLRPSTLFGTKFEEYLNAKVVKKENRQAQKNFGRTAEEKNNGFCFNPDEDDLADLF